MPSSSQWMQVRLACSSRCLLTIALPQRLGEAPFAGGVDGAELEPWPPAPTGRAAQADGAVLHLEFCSDFFPCAQVRPFIPRQFAFRPLIVHMFCQSKNSPPSFRRKWLPDMSFSLLLRAAAAPAERTTRLEWKQSGSQLREGRRRNGGFAADKPVRPVHDCPVDLNGPGVIDDRLGESLEVWIVRMSAMCRSPK